jgi:hypothetical protein
MHDNDFMVFFLICPRRVSELPVWQASAAPAL